MRNAAGLKQRLVKNQRVTGVLNRLYLMKIGWFITSLNIMVAPSMMVGSPFQLMVLDLH